QFHDPVAAFSAVPFCDEDVTVGRESNGVWLVEFVWSGPSHSGGAESHQYFALGREFVDLVASAILALIIGNPNISIRVDGDPVRHHHQPAAEIVQNLSGLIELENRIEL